MKLPKFKKLPKKLFLVFQNGTVDFVGVDLKQSKEMAYSPDDGSTENFNIDVWVFKAGKYQFEKRIQ